MAKTPDREALAEQLGKNYGHAVATGNTEAARIASRLIDKNEALARKEQNQR